MDKDSVILKYEQHKVDEAEKDLSYIKSKNHNLEKALSDCQSKINEMYSMIGKQPKQVEVTKIKPVDKDVSQDVEVLSYDQLFENAKNSLIERGLDIDSLDYHDLVSKEDLDEIIVELNRPLSKREKWNKNDFVVVFIASAIGSLADIILGTRDNPLTGADPRKHMESSYSAMLNKLHKHEPGGPIDYQGPGFGGGFHRGLSKGHDLLRFIEGILMFKNGQFEGIRYVDGVAHTVVSSVNQYGNPYEQLSLIDAICRYAQHMFGDLFSTCSLPFPGYSFLVESDNRQMRKFAANMYQNGFNCKNVITQGISTVLIEIIIRIYFSINSISKMKKDIDIAEDYSNWDAIKEFVKPDNQEKLNEMLLVAHAIVTAVNIGKVVIKKSPWEINITEIISVIKYGIRVVNANMARNSEYAKLIRNAKELHENWEKLEHQIILTEEESFEDISDVLEIA